MPAPVVEPRPSGPALRLGAPDDAQEASYLAASARMRSFLASFSSILPPSDFYRSSLSFTFCSSTRWRPRRGFRGDETSHETLEGPRIVAMGYGRRYGHR